MLVNNWIVKISKVIRGLVRFVLVQNAKFTRVHREIVGIKHRRLNFLLFTLHKFLTHFAHTSLTQSSK